MTAWVGAGEVRVCRARILWVPVGRAVLTAEFAQQRLHLGHVVHLLQANDVRCLCGDQLEDARATDRPVDDDGHVCACGRRAHLGYDLLALLLAAAAAGEKGDPMDESGEILGHATCPQHVAAEEAIVGEAVREDVEGEHSQEARPQGHPLVRLDGRDRAGDHVVLAEEVAVLLGQVGGLRLVGRVGLISGSE